jgi:hypothetical protein
LLDGSSGFACARARRKIENEGFNVLKNNGYNLAHNFGHGKKYLARTFAALKPCWLSLSISAQN